MNNQTVTTVILAAGKGTRLNSPLPKVLHKVKGKPSLFHVIELGEQFSNETVVVVGHRAEEVKQEVNQHYHGVKFALQEPQNGTGHAVSVALPEITGDYTLVLSGDVPFLSKESIQQLLNRLKDQNHQLAFIAARVADPARYGRVILNRSGDPQRIVEALNCSPEQLEIDLINSGVYLFKTAFLREMLPQVKRDPQKGEFYLTDLIEFGAKSSASVCYITPDPDETAGFNTPQELAALNQRP